MPTWATSRAGPSRSAKPWVCQILEAEPGPGCLKSLQSLL